MKNNMFTLFLASVWHDLSWYQFLVYYFFSETPVLKWLCPIVRFIDWLMRATWRLGIIFGRWFWRVMTQHYPRILRASVRFVFCYSLIVSLCGNPDVFMKLPLLEDILQHSEWLYEIAANFMDINIRFLKEVFDKLVEHATETNIKFVTEFDKYVEHFFVALESY